MATLASLGDTSWRVSIRTGLTRPVFATSSSQLALRWVYPESPDVAVHLSVGDRSSLDLIQAPGTLQGRIDLRIPLGENIDLGIAVRHLVERGKLRVVWQDLAPIDLDWKDSRTGASAGLTARFPNLGSIGTRIEHEEGTPEPVDARYQLQTRSAASGWSLDWAPASRGPWLDAAVHHAEIRSTGIVDSAGSSRDFHDMTLRSTSRSLGFGWDCPHGRIGLRGEDLLFEIPSSSYFEPFLAWNTFDPSPWSPVDQILSDQREHVLGTLEVRRMGATSSWRTGHGIWRLVLGADVDWWALDPNLVHRTTNMQFLGLGYSVASDTTISPRIRAWTLSPSTDFVIAVGIFGEIAASGRCTIPLVVARLGKHGDASGVSSGSSSTDDDPRGLWSSSLAWRKSW